MKIENNLNQNYVSNITDFPSKHNNHYDKETADSLADNGIKVEISKRGLNYAGEMEPFLDTYETTYTLLKGIGHIGSEKMINGSFAGILADNYQNELQKIKENYSGKEYDKQLAILDKAYEEAAKSASNGYIKQLKLLTGDIVIKPQTATFYTSEAAAEKAYQEDLKKDEEREPVIDSAMSDTIWNDVKNILLQLKTPALNQQDKENNIHGNYLSYNDIKKTGVYLRDNMYNSGTNDISSFAKSLLERYNALRTENVQL